MRRANPKTTPTASAHNVRPCKVEHDRSLIIIGSSDERFWGGEDGLGQPYDALGAIVWLSPPCDATDSDIAKAKELVKHAAVIKVLPRAPAPDVVLANSDDAPSDDAPKAIRDVVMTMVEGANTQCRSRLQDVVEDALSKAGL